MMRLLFLTRTTPAPIWSAESTAQDLRGLAQRLGSAAAPFVLGRWGPRRYRGWLSRDLRRRCDTADVIHVFDSTLCEALVLRPYASRIIYTVTSDLDETDLQTSLGWARRLGAIVLPCGRWDACVERHGLGHVERQATGVDADRFSYQPPAPATPFRLLCASGPWTRGDLERRGTRALLEAVADDPGLALTLVWRGADVDAARALIDRLGIAGRVQLECGRVDVAPLHREAHAAVALCTPARYVKAIPNSLQEALLTGRPVLLNRAIALADAVQRERWGAVVEELSTSAVAAGIACLRDDYTRLADRVQTLDRTRFCIEATARTYRRLQARVSAAAGPPRGTSDG